MGLRGRDGRRTGLLRPRRIPRLSSDRHPSRAAVAALYILGAAIDVGVCVWLVITTW
jgi:hypothetical protein